MPGPVFHREPAPEVSMVPLLLPFADALASPAVPFEVPYELETFGDPWSEVSVTELYDARYHTAFTALGLPALARARGRAMPDTWTLDALRYVQVLAFDAASTAPLQVIVAGQALTVFEPGPWTPPTRGYLPGGGPVIDVAKVLARHGYAPRTPFSLAVGGVVLDSSNTLRLAAPDGAMLAFNDNGGVWAGDGDCNEPLLFVWGARPAL